LNRLVFYFGKWDFVNVVLGIRKKLVKTKR